MDSRGVCNIDEYKKVLTQERNALLTVPDDYINMVLEDAESFTSDDFGKDTKLMDTSFQNYMNAAIGEINAILENVAMSLKHYQDVKNVRTGAQICRLMAKKVD